MSKEFAVTGKSVKELQFAMRGLPAQVTDIVTSLASGQRPMMVFLQQGGQLKDMFGGIKPAAKALGGALLGLINPFTVSAAAAVALGAAFVQAENDQAEFTKALLVTGNYAGKTASQLEAMAGSIAATANVSQGSAREALQRVAESGRFTGEQFDLVTLAAVKMESATGQSIDTTIKKFEDLGKAPVETLLKLNETEHFLTQAQLDRVRALKDEGKEQDAAAEAARIYAGRLDDVAAAAEAARPHLQQMWKDAKDGASGAWQETKNFVEFLAAAGEKSKEIPWYQRLGPIGGLRASISGMVGAQPSIQTPAKTVAGAIDSNQARAAEKIKEDAAKFKDRYLTREEEKTRELAELDKLRAQYSEQEYQSLKKQIDLKYADKSPASRPARSLDFSLKDSNLVKKQIEAEGRLQDQRKRSEESAKAYAASLKDMLDTRQQEIDLQVESIGMGAKEARQKQNLIAIDEDYNRKKASLERQQRNTSSEIDKAGYQKQLDDLKKYHDERVRMELDGARRADEARAKFSNGAAAALADFNDSAADVAGAAYNVFTNAFDGMAESLANFVLKGKGNFSDLVESFIADMVKMEARVLASRLLMSIFGGGMATGSMAGGAQNATIFDGMWGGAYAKGDVFFNSPSLSAYSGQVIDKPTMFAFARGAGVMGEAGPEAIMPLKRGPDGKLGVASSGKGVNDVQVEINITNQGQPVQAQQTGQRMDGNKLIIDMAIQAVANDMAKGGPTAQAAQQRFGLQRRGVPVGG